MASAAFRDPTNLSKWIKGFLYGLVATNIVSILFSITNYYTGTEGNIQSGAKGLVVGLEGLAMLVTIVGAGILILIWIYRASRNLRYLGADGLGYSPGWSVGWYFIPLANLWKPYGAVREIWQASSNPQNWQYEPVPAILSWWWFFWLGTNILANISFRLSGKDDNMSILLDVVSSAMYIPLCIVFISIITSIQKNQTRLNLSQNVFA
jgi:hypothetical protein